MNYLRICIYAGVVLTSTVTNFSARAAHTYQQHHAYRPYQPIYRYAVAQPRRDERRAARPYGYAGRAYGRFAYGAPAYRSAYRTVRPRAAGGGGGGMATFYDPGWRARGLTAAHLSLPMGTRIMVTNLANRRSVVVRIADRGPAPWTGRILDLSRTAAVSLGMIQSGVAPVTYHVIN